MDAWCHQLAGCSDGDEHISAGTLRSDKAHPFPYRGLTRSAHWRQGHPVGVGAGGAHLGRPDQLVGDRHRDEQGISSLVQLVGKPAQRRPNSAHEHDCPSAVTAVAGSVCRRVSNDVSEGCGMRCLNF